MNHSQAVGISAGCAIFGATLLAFLILSVPPQLPAGGPNFTAISAVILSATLLVGGLTALFIRLVHHRRALMASVYERRRSREPIVALRQGTLMAAGVAIVLTLAYLRILDAAYFIVTFVTLILIEALIQNRQQ